MDFPLTIFCAHVIGNFSPLSNMLTTSKHPWQQAEKGLISTNNIAQRNPIGNPNTNRTMNQIMLHNQPQLAMLYSVLFLYSLCSQTVHKVTGKKERKLV